MWQPATRVVAAVSGGSDSVAMLLLLHDLHADGALRLAAVAHLNHAIRPQAGDDEAFCRRLAEQLSLPFTSKTIDVPSLARQKKHSTELAARMARRAFLDEVRASLGADCIATAHTLDDQAETVLLRLLRGAGSRGAGAMAPVHGNRIRPVLCATRSELQQSLRERDQAWRDDATNLDLAHPRNRIRHELLPYLEAHFNPSARQALARFADLARADESLLARQAAAVGVALIEHCPEGVRIEREALLALPESLRRRVIQDALARARRSPAPTLQDVEAVLSVVTRACAGAEISGLRMEHSGGFVVLLTKEPPRWPPFRFDLPIPGELAFPEAGWIVEVTGPYPRLQAPGPGAHGHSPRAAGSRAQQAPGPRRHETVQVAADELGAVLVVRGRQPGDWLRPVGLGGRKKVQDVLVDGKVGRRDRDRVPIVTDLQGRIVWVAGHATSEEFRVTDDTKAVIILKLRRI